MVRNRYVQDIQKRPSDMLALGRTAMANERTLLSFISTTVGLLASSLGLIKFIEGKFFVMLGWILIPFSLLLLIFGIFRYFAVRRLLKESHSLMRETWNSD